MRKTIVLVLFFAACLSAGAQTKYYRLKIYADDNGLKQLALKGVGFDHGEYKHNEYFISDFSERELSIIKKTNYKFDVLISDVSSYYMQRSKATAEETEKAEVNCTYATPINFKYGTMGGYYKYNELLQTLDSMAKKFPKLISIKKPISITLKTAGGRPLYYVRISNRPKIEQNKPKILYTALHHAREPESLSQLVFFMWYVLEHYSTDADIKNIVDNCEMYFVPCVNPDGYVYNQTTNPQGGGLWRKNRRNDGDGNFGVDLNRNYGFKWGYDDFGSSPNTADETYRGPSAFSEPETRLLDTFCHQHYFYMAINNHTFGNYLIYPYGYKPNTYTPDSLLFKQYAQQLTQCNKFLTGTTIQTVGYTANGNSDDWMYGDQTQKPKVFALTPETGTGNDGFWPVQSRIIPIAQKNMQMNIMAAQITAGITVTAKNIIANNDELNTIKLNAYPNPCNTQTTISFNAELKSGNAKLLISDVYGNPVKTIALNMQQSSVVINIESLKPGIYYYTIISSNYKSETQKFYVVK